MTLADVPVVELDRVLLLDLACLWLPIRCGRATAGMDLAKVRMLREQVMCCLGDGIGHGSISRRSWQTCRATLADSIGWSPSDFGLHECVRASGGLGSI